MITITINGQLYLTAHCLDAAETSLLAFRQIAPATISVEWADTTWHIPCFSNLPPHHQSHCYRKRVIEVVKALYKASRPPALPKCPLASPSASL